MIDNSREGDRGSPSSAEDAFALFLARREVDDSVDLDSVCRDYPQFEDELRSLYDVWSRYFHKLLDKVRDSLVSDDFWQSSVIEDVDPRITLPEDGPRERSEECVREDLEEGDRDLAGIRTTQRYDIHEPIGQGGMGVVLRVWDRDLRRHLAMKRILNERDSKGDSSPSTKAQLRRFLEEAQITGQLEHPGIVPVHELSLDADGRMFFTMQLVKGKTFAEVIDLVNEGDRDWAEARGLGVISRACEAVAYAHSRGVIHRDLKPSNIMVGKFGETYVMDWGLAKVIGRPDDEDLRAESRGEIAEASIAIDRATDDRGRVLRTMKGAVIGTPSYMSPEQARGESDRLSMASDVYSMGAVMYHLLAHNAPYHKKEESVSAEALLRRVLEGPPSEVSSANPNVAAELVAICEKAMEREPARRYRDMIEMAEDLRAYLEGRVVKAHRTGPWIEARKWTRRNRALATSMVFGLVLLVAGLTGIALVQSHAKTVVAEKNEQLTQTATEILGLSDVKRLGQYVSEADALWPAWPENLTDIETWLGKARELSQRVNVHREVLYRMRSELYLEGTEEKRVLGDMSAMAKAASRGSETSSIEASLEELTSKVETPTSWTFASTEEQWQHDTLDELITGLVALRDGLIPEVESRAERAEGLKTLARDPRTGWKACLEQLADPVESPLYGGLIMEVQIGLVPLGVDPDSGLFEFVDVQTGTVPLRVDGKLQISEETGLIFVLIPGGTFLLGSELRDELHPQYSPYGYTSESPMHEATLAPYFLSKYEMTQEQWIHCTGNNPSFFSYGGRKKPPVPTPLNPVESVSWRTCDRLLTQLGWVLPTEAQWEFGARAGTRTTWWTGQDPESLKGAANIRDLFAGRSRGPRDAPVETWLNDGHEYHAPVGLYRANAFGLHDVYGNVWEWCRDAYVVYSEVSLHGDGLHADPSTSRYRPYRGGGYNSAAVEARSAYRPYRRPDNEVNNIGVRPARRIR